MSLREQLAHWLGSHGETLKVWQQRKLGWLGRWVAWQCHEQAGRLDTLEADQLLLTGCHQMHSEMCLLHCQTLLLSC